MLPSSKVLAFCLRAISSALGWRQLPGEGVETAAWRCWVEGVAGADMMACLEVRIGLLCIFKVSDWGEVGGCVGRYCWAVW